MLVIYSKLYIYSINILELMEFAVNYSNMLNSYFNSLANKLRLKLGFWLYIRGCVKSSSPSSASNEIKARTAEIKASTSYFP